MRILREPLFHFLLLGLAIFAWFAWRNPPGPAPSEIGTIIIDSGDVERISQQFRGTWRRDPSAEELSALVAALVREEVFVREARALGLDRGDSVVRNRLAQKMQFLTTSLAQSLEPDDPALVAHLEQNSERFQSPARVGFEQIYLGETVDETEIEAARTALAEGADPRALGRPSLLPGNLPLSHEQAVNGSFGKGFFDALQSAPEGEWTGPVRSGFGMHLVRVNERVSAQVPPFDGIRAAVLADWRRETSSELSEARFDALKTRYEVVLPETLTPEPQVAQ